MSRGTVPVTTGKGPGEQPVRQGSLAWEAPPLVLQYRKRSEMRLLFVHGAGGGADVWRFQAAHFPGSVAVDLPGHPQGQGSSSIEGYAAWVRDFAYSRELAPLVLVGHSMGGAIGQWLAIHCPEMLRGLVLVSTGARLRVAPLVFQALESDYEKAVDLLLDLSFGPQASLSLKQEVKGPRLRVPREVVLGDFQACDRFDVMGRLHGLNIPTLIICGAEDGMTPIRYAEYLHSQVSGSRLVEVSGAGHNVMLEKPEEFNRALEDFLGGLEGHEAQ